MKRIILMLITSLSMISFANAYANDQDHERNKLKFNLGGVKVAVPVGPKPREYSPPPRPEPRYEKPLEWVFVNAGDRLPRDLVKSGYVRDTNTTMFVCRADFRGGTHPGKLYRDICNISYGGDEIQMRRYQVLVSRKPLVWVRGSHGSLPRDPVRGGYEGGQTLYICQADYRDGWHSGKIVGDACNFGWRGREISIPYYKVLAQ